MRALTPKGQESQTIPLPSTTGSKPDGRFVCPEPRCGKSYKDRLAFQSRHAGKTFTTADHTRVDENIDNDNRKSPLLEGALEADTTVTVQEMEATPIEQKMENKKRRVSGYQEQCCDGWPDLTWPDMEKILTTSDYRATEDALKVGTIAIVQEMVVTPSE